MTYEDDPKYHWEGENSYGDGAEISGRLLEHVLIITDMTGIQRKTVFLVH